VKRRRDREQASEDGTVPSSTDLVTHQPQVLDQPLARVEVDIDAVSTHDRRLRASRSELTHSVDGIADVDPTGQKLLQQIAALRGLLELDCDRPHFRTKRRKPQVARFAAVPQLLPT
jgi:hypothetical protein